VTKLLKRIEGGAMTELVRTPVGVAWQSADVPSGGVVALVDRDGFVIAYAETQRYGWRRSGEGKRFLWLAELINVALGEGF